jgi:hypothetical protein
MVTDDSKEQTLGESNKNSKRLTAILE